MTLQRSRFIIIYCGVGVSLVFWLFETLLHYWWFNPEKGFQLWPNDNNELWMRAFIGALFVAFSCFIQYFHNKSLKIEQQKLALFRATMNTVMDIEGNFLNKLGYYHLELAETRTLTPQSMDEVQSLVRSTHEQLKSLAAAAAIREEMAAGTIPVIKHSPTSSD